MTTINKIVAETAYDDLVRRYPQLIFVHHSNDRSRPSITIYRRRGGPFRQEIPDNGTHVGMIHFTNNTIVFYGPIAGYTNHVDYADPEMETKIIDIVNKWI